MTAQLGTRYTDDNGEIYELVDAATVTDAEKLVIYADYFGEEAFYRHSWPAGDGYEAGEGGLVVRESVTLREIAI